MPSKAVEECTGLIKAKLEGHGMVASSSVLSASSMSSRVEVASSRSTSTTGPFELPF